MKEQKGYNPPPPVILPLFLPCTPAEQPALSSPGQTSPLLVFPEKLSHQELDLLDASLSLAALGQRGRRRGHFQLTGPRPATGAALWSLFSCPSRGALHVTVEGVCVQEGGSGSLDLKANPEACPLFGCSGFLQTLVGSKPPSFPHT